LDLPTVAKMLEQIRGSRLLTRIIARRLRPDLLKLERNIKELTALVDRFYALLGSRHWIFHENLNTEKIQGILNLPADEAERALIEIYKEPGTLDFMIRRLMRFSELGPRMRLIESAREDYASGRYYSTVLVLLAVMDGFVNDLEVTHRGLHTRAEEEMVAWDSIVGHHLGLTNAHRSFTKSFSKTLEEEVHELYRNGIMHGNLVNFSNDIVATKAWNRLFAVADWATSRQKQSKPKEPEPTWRELLAKIRQNEDAKKALAEWKPRAVIEEDASFRDEPVYRVAADYLSSWQKKNYGRMAELVATLMKEATHGETARMVRESCSGFEPEDYSIHRLDFQAAAVCEVDVSLTRAGEVTRAQMRWIREGEDGMAAMPNQPGEWRLAIWAPSAMINRADSD
jgi:hypothetical protein